MASTGETAPSLPARVAQYTTAGLYGLLLGTVLCLVDLFTNPVPDPSFPWATLPPSLRLPLQQPRIEHWPVTYTVGIWLWVFCFPALFFAGYRRYGDSNRGGSGVVRWITNDRDARLDHVLSVLLAEAPPADLERPGLHVRLLAVLFDLRRPLE
jgi:hypothetical protein